MQIIFVSQLLDYGYNKLLILLNTKILGEISVFVHWKGARNAFCQVFKKKTKKKDSNLPCVYTNLPPKPHMLSQEDRLWDPVPRSILEDTRSILTRSSREIQ